MNAIEIQTENFQQEESIQTEECFLTAPEERQDFPAHKKISMNGSEIPIQNLLERTQAIDAYLSEGFVHILTQDQFYKCPINKLTYQVPAYKSREPLTSMDCRAQKKLLKGLDYKKYIDKCQSVNLQKDQYLHLVDARDNRMMLNKILHDYNVSFELPESIIKCYYDIETVDTMKSEVPQHTSMSAFITCIGMVMVKDGQILEKKVLINSTMEYQMDTLDKDIQYISGTEKEICQIFFRSLQELSQINNTICLCIGHNASTNPRGQPYDLVWLQSRSLYRLNVLQKQYKDRYSATDGQIITKITEFSRIYFYDTIRAVGEQFAMDKKKIPSLGLDSVCQHLNIQGKSDDMSYKLLHKISKTFQSEFGRVASYCVQDCLATMNLDEKLDLSNKRLTFVSKCRVPLQMALNDTVAQCLTALLQQEYRDQGYSVPYNSNKTRTDAFKGAFTSVDQYGLCGIDDILLQVDYTSMYPSSILQLSICLSSVSEKSSGSYVQKQLTIEDEGETSVTYYYKQSPSNVLPSVVQKWKASRLEGKKLIKTLTNQLYNEVDPEVIRQINQRVKQAQIDDAVAKSQLNTLYGLLGQQSSVLYHRPLAQSVTAFCRQTIMMTRQIVQDMGCSLIASDTDSVSYATNRQFQTAEQILSHVSNINLKLQQTFESEYMQVEIEEIILPQQQGQGSFYNFSSKSYMFTYAKLSNGQFYFSDGTQWTLDNKNGPCYQKQRGFVTGSFSKQIQQRLQGHLMTIYNVETDPLQLVQNAYTQEHNTLLTAIQQNDIITTAQYSKRVKVGGSSQQSNYIRTMYNPDTNFIDIVHTKGLKRSQCVLPIDKITSLNAQSIDVCHHAVQISNALLKVVRNNLTEEQKKLVPKVSSKSKQQIIDLADDLDDDDLVIRLEKPFNGGVKYDFFKQEAYQYNPTRKNCAYHEIITKNNVRWFADIDHSSTELFQQFIMVCQQVFQESYNFYVDIKYLFNPVSNGYHVYTNVSMNIQLCKFIADRINARMGQSDYVDLAPYGLYKSLRLFNCPKVSRTGEINCNSRYEKPTDAPAWRYMVTNTNDCIQLSAPLHISQDLPIDPIYQHGLQNIDDQYIQSLKQYVVQELKVNDFVITQESNRAVIHFGAQRPICPYHKRPHDNENMMVRCMNNKDSCGMLLYCFRETQGEVKYADRVFIPVEADKLDNMDRLIRDKTNFINTTLPDSIISNSKYVEIVPSVRDHKIIYLKSQLGTGKTEQIYKMIEEQNYKRVLYISFRKTFTQALAKRFENLGNILQYNDVRGDIYFNNDDLKYRVIVIQIESLNRFKDTSCDLLVVDEWESVLSQMNSVQGVSVIDCFKRLVQDCKKCVIMDGFLQQTSIDLFNRVNNVEQYSIQENIYKPFTEHTANVYISNKHSEVANQIFKNVSDVYDNGGKSCVFVTCNSQSERLEGMLKQDFPDMKLKRYHGKQTKIDENGLFHVDNKREDMRNINEIAKDCDVLIYTSTITAGISIDEVPFQYMCGWLYPNTCDPMQFVQGLHRVRTVDNKKIDVFVHGQWYLQSYTSPRQISPEGYEVLLTKSLKEQLLIHLQARDNCLKAQQQWMVIVQLMQMGYQTNLINLDETRVEVTKEERKESRQKMKMVRENINQQDYCDWSQPITEQAIHLYDRVKNYQYQAKPDEVQQYANQIKCMQQAFTAGLNPQEANTLPDRLDNIKKLSEYGMMTNNDDDNMIISNYIKTFDEQISFRKRIQKVCAMGHDVNSQQFEEALKRDIQDRSQMGVSNKSISITEINNQLLALRTASKIQLGDLPQCVEFDCGDKFDKIIEDLKIQKCRTYYQVIQKAFNSMGLLCIYKKKEKQIQGKRTQQNLLTLAPMP